jgi:hypothetical protein
MSRRASVLLHGAVIAIGAAMIATGARGPAQPRPRAPARSPARVTPSNSPRPRAPVIDGAITVARAYALAARNWTARTYVSAWRRQHALATGRYRNQLAAARPTRAQLAALRTDAAASSATALRVERDARVRGPHARVVVWLDERTHAAGQTIAGTTRNQVLLRLDRTGRWRVTGWTAIPGEGKRR